MPARAFQYYAVLLDIDEESLKMRMYLLPARASAVRIEPLQRAHIQFVLENDRLRPYKYLVKDETGSDYRQPKEITKTLREAKGIIIPHDEIIKDYHLFEEYFKTFNINEPTFRRICRLCLIDQGRITILPKGSEYSVSGREACYQCAKDELRREIEGRELNLSRNAYSHYNRVLRKVKNVDKIGDMFHYNFRPAKRPELTLFDVLGNVDDFSNAKYVDHCSIPGKIKRILKKNGIKRILPIQVKALEAGLLDDEDMLIVAGTSSGKTLIGEIAALKKIFNGERMLYLSPLVALTNQKYEDFKRKYGSEGLQVAIRVGMSRIDVGKKQQYIIDTDFREAQIITATYEAFDLLLRSGRSKALGKVGTVIIDEIQLLNDEERGPEIDGLIVRIKELFPEAQILGLSATIGNSEELANELGLKLLVHEARPVPLERHVIISRDAEEKLKHLVSYARAEYHHTSSHNYHGQSIIFTNSRKHCYELASYLNRNRVKTAVYHSGLTFNERKEVEKRFEDGFYAAVVTTAALGAGVDFPASQVIFESLAMGIKWLSVAEFHQMIGRAGRLGYHDRGKAILLVEPDKKYHSSMDGTEDDVAFELLTEPIEPVEAVMAGDKQLEQILATIVALEQPTLKQLVIAYRKLLGPSETLKSSLHQLKELDMVSIYDDGPQATNLGRATARTYLSPTQAGSIQKRIKARSPLEIAIELEPFSAIFVNNKLQSAIEHTLKSGYIGSNLFSGSLLEFMQTSLDDRSSLPTLVVNTFSRWQQEIFKCNCPENPWCDCGQSELSRIIVKMRLKPMNLKEITKELDIKYNLYAYPGDIYRWFDTLIHHLRAVAKLALVFQDKKTTRLALNTIKLIERPWIVPKKKRKKITAKRSTKKAS
jgi:helicase